MLCLVLAASHLQRHCEPEPNVQVKVNKRCLWIFRVTNSNLCLHSSCNYLLTDLILAVKWLAKSMCTQTRPESMEVHAIYLLAPSHTWYIAINEPDRKDTQHDLTGHEPDKHDDWLLTHKKEHYKYGEKDSDMLDFNKVAIDWIFSGNGANNLSRSMGVFNRFTLRKLVVL